MENAIIVTSNAVHGELFVLVVVTFRVTIMC